MVRTHQRIVHVGAILAIFIKATINHYICAKQSCCYHGDPNDPHCFAYQQKKLPSGGGLNSNLPGSKESSMEQALPSAPPLL